MKIHNEPKTIRKGSTIAALCFLFAMGTMSDVMAQESDTLKFPIRDQKGGLFLDNQIKYDVQRSEQKKIIKVSRRPFDTEKTGAFLLA